jgi:hypothetical protein
MTFRQPGHPTGRGQRLEDGSHVTGEKLAAGGQRELSAWSGAQQGGADGGLELADLAGEDRGPDAELAGCVVQAGLAGRARSLRMRCSAPGWVKTLQTSGGNAPPRAERGWPRPLTPWRMRMPALRAVAARSRTGGPWASLDTTTAAALPLRHRETQGHHAAPKLTGAIAAKVSGLSIPVR